MSVAETAYFHSLKEKALNKLTSDASEWREDAKYKNETERVLQRVEQDLEQGILLNLKTKRMQQLDGLINKNCF